MLKIASSSLKMKLFLYLQENMFLFLCYCILTDKKLAFLLEKL